MQKHKKVDIRHYRHRFIIKLRHIFSSFSIVLFILLKHCLSLPFYNKLRTESKKWKFMRGNVPFHNIKYVPNLRLIFDTNIFTAI